MQESTGSPDTGQPPAPTPPDQESAIASASSSASSGDTGETNGHSDDRTPQTHEEWTAFAALPDSERAEVYLRSLPMALLLLAVAMVGR